MVRRGWARWGVSRQKTGYQGQNQDDGPSAWPRPSPMRPQLAPALQFVGSQSEGEMLVRVKELSCLSLDMLVRVKELSCRSLRRSGIYENGEAMARWRIQHLSGSPDNSKFFSWPCRLQ